MKKLKMTFILLILLLQLVCSNSDKPNFGDLISIEYKDINNNILFISWAVYMGENADPGKDVFEFTDCSLLKMEDIKDNSGVHVVEVEKDVLLRCINELKEECKPLGEAQHCQTLLPFFGENGETVEGVDSDDKFQFGDLVAFHRFTKEGVLKLIHWAVYVGKGPVEGLEKKTDEQDIFHLYGPTPEVWWKLSDCVFDIMKHVKGKKKRLNYLDGVEDWKPLGKAEIIKAITALHRNCYHWDPLMNNCEHVATMVRYGKKNFQQPGAMFSYWTKFKWKPTFKLPISKRVLRDPSSLRYNSVPHQHVAGA